MNIKSRLLAKDDEFGNRLYMRVFSDEHHYDTSATIHLKLSSEKHGRQLGFIDLNTKTFYCKRDTTKHYHYKTKSFGFNYSLLSDEFLNIEKVVVIVDNAERLSFPIKLLESHGKFLNFKSQGFELQKFLELAIIREQNHKNDEHIQASTEPRMDAATRAFTPESSVS